VDNTDTSYLTPVSKVIFCLTGFIYVYHACTDGIGNASISRVVGIISRRQGAIRKVRDGRSRFEKIKAPVLKQARRAIATFLLTRETE